MIRVSDLPLSYRTETVTSFISLGVLQLKASLCVIYAAFNLPNSSMLSLKGQLTCGFLYTVLLQVELVQLFLCVCS